MRHTLRHNAHRSSVAREKTATHKQFLDWLGEQLGHNLMDDWYDVTVNTIHAHGGQGVLLNYNDSPSMALKSVYPQHNWMPWKFKRAPKGFWERLDNQLEYFNWLGNQLGYRSVDDWYNVTRDDIHRHGGQGLLHDYYNDSPSTAL